MATLFGDFRVRIDPWEVDYGDQTPLLSLEARPDQQVDHEVEVSDGQWSALTPSDSTAVPERVVFVDGVRRLEGRCCTARSKSLTSLCRLQSHPAQYVSGIPSAAILLSISHPIRCSTRCLANVRARISGPMIAL